MQQHLHHAVTALKLPRACLRQRNWAVRDDLGSSGWSELPVPGFFPPSSTKTCVKAPNMTVKPFAAPAPQEAELRQASYLKLCLSSFLQLGTGATPMWAVSRGIPAPGDSGGCGWPPMNDSGAARGRVGFQLRLQRQEPGYQVSQVSRCPGGGMGKAGGAQGREDEQKCGKTF